MDEVARQINIRSGELQSLLVALEGHQQSVQKEWKIVAGDDLPLVDWKIEAVLPSVSHSDGAFIVDKLLN